MNDELKQFIEAHKEDDLTKLLLSAPRYSGIDVPFAVDQIASRRQIREKLPTWYINPDLIFPSRVATEQCSSEATASYKERFIYAADHACDLTGGMGVDSYFFAQRATAVTYIERYSSYCEAARNNFKALGVDNITVLEGDSLELLKKVKDIDLLYVDPARRGNADKRVYALADCEPDLTGLIPQLLEKAPTILIKVSPMIDISHTLESLPSIMEVHVLSVRNECKELLFLIDKENGTDNPQIYTWNLRSDGTEESFYFTFREEKEVNIDYSSTVQSFLYEPNASILKAGAFKMVAFLHRGMTKLHASSHLYTFDQFLPGFPGRTFEVKEVYPFNNKILKTLSQKIPQANITVRNFPLTVAELRKRTKIKDGGDTYLFATTLANGDKVLVDCRKVEAL